MFYMPLAWGLLAYQLQPGAPLSPRGLQTSGSIHSPSTIWARSQIRSKTNQGAREVSRRGFTEICKGPTSDVSAPLSAVGWEFYGVKISTCLLTPCCESLPSSWILFSVQKICPWVASLLSSRRTSCPNLKLKPSSFPAF